MELFRFAFDHVPFYRNLYQDHGITRSSIESLSDLPKLPIVTREMLANSVSSTTPSRLGAPLQGRTSTSGSSGRPLAVTRSFDCVLRHGAQILRQLDVWGLAGKRKVFFCLYNEDPTMSVDLPYSRPLSILNRSHSIRFNAPIPAIYARLLQGAPDALVTYASRAEEICDWVNQSGEPYPRPIAFSVGAEILTPALVNKFHEAFPAGDIYSVYGCVEMGPVAFECPCHTGLHINDWSLVMEEGERYQGPEGDTSFRPIYTNLWNRGTPFIRYAGIDDLIVTGRSSCGCGYEDRVIRRLHGRVREMLQSPTTADVPVSAIVSAHADLKGVKRFQYVQKDRHAILFRYVPYPGANHEEIRATARRETERLLGDRIRFDCEVVPQIRRKPGNPKVQILVRR